MQNRVFAASDLQHCLPNFRRQGRVRLKLTQNAPDHCFDDVIGVRDGDDPCGNFPVFDDGHTISKAASFAHAVGDIDDGPPLFAQIIHQIEQQFAFGVVQGGRGFIHNNPLGI